MQAKTMQYIEVKRQEIPVIFEKSQVIPVGFMRLSFLGGGKINDGSLLGLASMGARLLNEGTKTLGVIKFSEELDKRAISLHASAGVETLNIELSFLKEKETEALQLLQDLLLDPNYTQKTLDKIKQDTINMLLAKENDFDYLADKNLSKHLFENTPLAQSATKETIENITLSDIKSFLEDNLVLSRIVVVVGGDLNEEKILHQIKQLLSHLETGKKAPNHKYEANPKPSQSTIYKDTQQAYIYFGSPFYLTDLKKESYKAKILSFVLGSSGFGSRLMEEIRVKRGLAYSAYLRVNTGKIINYASGYLQTKLENQNEAIQLVQDVVNNFITNGITQEELDGAKQFLLGSDPLRRETLAQRLNEKFQNYYLDLPLDFNQLQLEQIQNITLDEINTYIKSHTELKQLTFSVLTLQEDK
ncbi:MULTISPECIES: M16 family metallopeptidase [unclassified Helicobacter]|uniref:M16 family metallopeptidase n=1 Tax=unclassified Helicobacter TaxID=2593540 RepID=UPI000CF1A78E|nr:MULTISPECIES: pitrilysin family protein [unclassified Helicobacter]